MITGSAHRVLTALLSRANPIYTIGELATLLSLHKSTIYRSQEKLVESGLLEVIKISGSVYKIVRCEGSVSEKHSCDDKSNICRTSVSQIGTITNYRYNDYTYTGGNGVNRCTGVNRCLRNGVNRRDGVNRGTGVISNLEGGNGDNRCSSRRCIHFLTSPNTQNTYAEKVDNMPRKKVDNSSRTAEQAPSLPVKVSEVANQEHAFPYAKTSLSASAIWYWAIMRYKLHGIDFEFNPHIFKQMITKYNAGLKNSFGKDWQTHREYIDWFLANSDPFIRNTTRYGFDFMCSAHCKNKRYAQAVSVGPKIIDDDEERRTYRGIELD